MITVVGESLVDVVDARETHSEHPGGSPANVAVGLARLGSPAALITRLGADAHGELVREHLRANGVRPAGVLVDGEPTSVARATLDATGGATYSFDLHWDLPHHIALPSGTTCVHAGSLGAHLPPGAAVVRRLIDAARPTTTVSYDPNCRPALMESPAAARAEVEGWVGRSDVVKASAEDVAWLYAGCPPLEVARAWHRRGPALVVVTRGGDGVLAVAASGVVTRPAVPVAVVDTVGAGDAFTAALLDGLRRGDLLGGRRRARLRALSTEVLARLLDRAALAAALTCARPGADPPTERELTAAGG
jgi:fructokinase